MNFHENIASDTPPAKMEEESKKEQLLLGLKEKMRKLLSENSKHTIVENLKKELEKYCPVIIKNMEEVELQLNACENIENPEEFIQKVVEISEPVINFKVSNPTEYEQLQQKRYRKINDIFYYEITGEGDDQLNLHVYSAYGKNLVPLMKEGMRKLAEIVQAKKNIKFVNAASWIVASHPRILERLGFEVLGEVDEDTMTKDFPGEDRPVSRAVLSREKLLKFLPGANG